MAVDQEGKVTIFNPAAEAITGVRREEILGRKVTELIPNSKLLEVMEEKKEDLGQLQYFGGKLTLTNGLGVPGNGIMFFLAVPWGKNFSAINILLGLPLNTH